MHQETLLAEVGRALRVSRGKSPAGDGSGASGRSLQVSGTNAAGITRVQTEGHSPRSAARRAQETVTTTEALEMESGLSCREGQGSACCRQLHLRAHARDVGAWILDPDACLMLALIMAFRLALTAKVRGRGRAQTCAGGAAMAAPPGDYVQGVAELVVTGAAAAWWRARGRSSQEGVEEGPAFIVELDPRSLALIARAVGKKATTIGRSAVTARSSSPPDTDEGDDDGELVDAGEMQLTPGSERGWWWRMSESLRSLAC